MINKDGSSQQIKAVTSKYQYLFHGNHYFYRNFEHKSINCGENIGNNELKNGIDYKYPKKNPPRNTKKEAQKYSNQNYNSFSPLMDNDVDCFKFHNLGHKAYQCTNRLELFEESRDVQPLSQ